MAYQRCLQLQSCGSNVLVIVHCFGLRCGQDFVFCVKTSVEGVDEDFSDVGCGVFCGEGGGFSDGFS